MREAIAAAESAAFTLAPVVFKGPRGAGRCTLARHIHARSEIPASPLAVVNCERAAEVLLRSIVIGESGSEPGGTLILREAQAIPPALRGALDRLFARYQRSRRGRLLLTVDESADLGSDHRQWAGPGGMLVEIRVPPLRERAADIPRLARSLARRTAISLGRPTPSFTPDAEALLCRQDWPGNLRQLADVLDRAMSKLVLWPAPVLDAGDLARALVPSP
jgi:two-component system response regulator PilR (NtrC family)